MYTGNPVPSEASLKRCRFKFHNSIEAAEGRSEFAVGLSSAGL